MNSKNPSLPDVARLRMESQQLTQSAITSATELVSWFGAVQGQEYAQTKWGLGLRLPHLVDEDIEKELNEGSILRTHVLRPTWHFVVAQDIRWMLALTSPRVNTANAYMYRKLELDDRTFKRSNAIIENLLQGGKQLTRVEINTELNQHNVSAEGFRLTYIMMRCELDGIICSGVRRGNQITYALLEERVPKAKGMTKEEALLELTKRYLHSRGPATIHDYSTWSGLTQAECKRGIEFIGKEAERLTVEEKEYYFVGQHNTTTKSIPKLCLLPIYDEFIMGYKDRSPSFQFFKKHTSGERLQFDCMILWDGQVIGTWKRVVGKNTMEVEAKVFIELTATQQKYFQHTMDRYAVFHDKEVVYDWSVYQNIN